MPSLCGHGVPYLPRICQVIVTAEDVYLLGFKSRALVFTVTSSPSDSKMNKILLNVFLFGFLFSLFAPSTWLAVLSRLLNRLLFCMIIVELTVINFLALLCLITWLLFASPQAANIARMTHVYAHRTLKTIYYGLQCYSPCCQLE